MAILYTISSQGATFSPWAMESVIRASGTHMMLTSVYLAPV